MSTLPLFPTSLVGSYPHPDWPIDLFTPAVEPVDTIVSGVKKAPPFIDR